MPPHVTTSPILAIDVGATSIKLCEVGPNGELLGAVQQRPTPYPCAPERLVDVVAREIRSRGCTRVGVGFPGEFHDGLVVEPGNLSRPGGFTSEVDPTLHEAWRSFDLQEWLRRESGRDVRVVNDATMAALGCSEGTGRELVFTLGTGFGIALVVDGGLVRIRDVGAEVFREGLTYDVALGEHSRARDDVRWAQLLRVAVTGFVDELAVTTVHLGGGNARWIEPEWFAGLPVRVVLHGNDASLRGAARLFPDAS